MELNPNNKVVRQVRDHWHKVAALIMVKLGKTELVITLDDVRKIEKGCNIVLDARGEADTGIFRIRIVGDEEASELAKKEGGRLVDS